MRNMIDHARLLGNVATCRELSTNLMHCTLCATPSIERPFSFEHLYLNMCTYGHLVGHILTIQHMQS